MLVPQILFSGLFVPIPQIPVFIRWAEYLCFLGYGVKLLALNEFYWAGSVKEQLAYMVVQGTLPPQMAPIEMANTTEDDLGIYLGVTFALIVVFRIVTVFGLLMQGKKAIQ